MAGEHNNIFFHHINKTESIHCWCVSIQACKSGRQELNTMSNCYACSIWAQVWKLFTTNVSFLHTFHGTEPSSVLNFGLGDVFVFCMDIL